MRRGLPARQVMPPAKEGEDSLATALWHSTRWCHVLVGLGTGATVLHAQAAYGVSGQPALNGAFWQQALDYAARHGAAPQLIVGDFNFPLDDLLQAPPTLQGLLLTRRLVDADSELAAAAGHPPCARMSGCGEDAPPALMGCWWTPAWQPCCADQRCCRRAASRTIARCASTCSPRGRCRVWSSSCACPGWSFRHCQKRSESLWCRACWTPWGLGGTRSWQPGTWTACGQRRPGRRRRRCWRSQSQGSGRARSYPRLLLITRGAGAQCGC